MATSLDTSNSDCMNRKLLTFPVVEPSLVGPHVLLPIFVRGGALTVRLSRRPLTLPTRAV